MENMFLQTVFISIKKLHISTAPIILETSGLELFYILVYLAQAQFRFVFTYYKYGEK